MMTDVSLEFASADKRNILSFPLLQSSSYDLSILDLLEDREENLLIGKFGYEALHDGKTDKIPMKVNMRCIFPDFLKRRY